MANNITRDCQASTHGMAWVRDGFVGLRDADRADVQAPISLTGVDSLKYSTNPGVSWTNSA